MNKFLAGVIGAGAAGGFVAWVFAETIGEPMKLATAAAIAASVVLGAGAGLIGILLANTDRTDLTRALVFAFACGVFWRPVYEAGGAYMKRLPEVKQEAKAADAAKRLDETLAGLPAAAAGPDAALAVGRAGAATSELLAAASRVKDVTLRTEYERRASGAVATIAAFRAPAAARAGALAEVGRAAADEGQSAIAVDAVRSLEATAVASPDPRTIELRDSAFADLQGKAAARNDLRLKQVIDEARRQAPGRPPG